MEELEILEKNNYEYTLQSKNGNRYVINMEFLDIDKSPEVGDVICISKNLLTSSYYGYSTSYTFGDIKSKYGKKVISAHDAEVIKILKDGKKIYLKRIYG